MVQPTSPRKIVAALAILFSASFMASPACADTLPLGAAGNFAVLYEGTGGHNLQITNVTINGNVGVGGTGVVQDNGPSTINGALDFSASNTGQFHNNNGANVGPTSVNFNNTPVDVSGALTTVNNLSSTLGGLSGTGLAINGNQTINASSGTLHVIGGVSYLVFNITSYTETDGKIVTINGAGGDVVVFNFSSSLGNVNLGGDVTLNGLTGDQVLWNFTGSGQNVGLNNNASSFPLPLAFMGDILAPNDALSLVNANLDGRVLGGDSSDMQIVSGTTINSTIATPEPGTLFSLASGLLALAGFRRRRFVKS